MIRILKVHYALLNGLLRIAQALFFGPIPLGKKQAIKKILIFRNGSFGDIICALPAIVSIQKNFPNSQIDLMTNSGGASLVSAKNVIDHRLINKFINYLGMDRRELIRQVRESGYQLFIELPQDQASLKAQLRNIIVVKYLFRIRKGFGWEIGATRFLKKQQEKLIKFKDERTRLLKILERHGLKNYGETFPLHILPEDQLPVNQLFNENGISSDDLLIAFVVGAKRPFNRWPIAYFHQVASHLCQQGYKALIVGGPDDTDLAKELIYIPGVYDFTGKLTPMQSGLALQRCQLTISNDTGPMHLSYAVGTRVIAIFSTRDYPNKWYPPEGNAVFRDENDKNSVSFTETDTNNECMKAILPEVIMAKAEEFLKEVRR